MVNAGDLLARWSNDAVRSTEHRVVGGAGKGERYSCAYFCNPNKGAWIEALPGTWEASGKRYDGIRSEEYLEQRLANTYTY